MILEQHYCKSLCYTKSFSPYATAKSQNNLPCYQIRMTAIGSNNTEQLESGKHPNTSLQCVKDCLFWNLECKGEFPVIGLAGMFLQKKSIMYVLAANILIKIPLCENCLRVVSTMTGKPALYRFRKFGSQTL